MSIADKLTTIAENQQKVYDSGSNEGYEQAISELWDCLQQKGERTNYNNAFACYSYSAEYQTWNEKNFKPKYDITANSSAQRLFYNVRNLDIGKIMKDRGLTFDFSKAVETFIAFSNCNGITELGVIDCSGVKHSGGFTQGMTKMFAGCSKLHTIEKLVMPNNATAPIVDIFTSCFMLSNITIEGTIYSAFSIYSSTLTIESAKSIINALTNYVGTNNEFKHSVWFSSNVKDKLKADVTSPNGNSWYDYIMDKGWNN